MKSKFPFLSLSFAMLITITMHISEANGAASDEEKPFAPDFTLDDLDGNPVTLSDFKGKIILLNFWATWCGPCKWEIPHLIEISKEYSSEDLQVLGVAISSGSLEKVTAFARSLRISYPILTGDDNKLAKIVGDWGGFTSIPSTFLIDRTGRVRYYYRGARMKSTFKRDIEILLTEK